MRDEAEHFAREYLDLEYFPHSLELLTHTLLELEFEEGTPKLLPRVVSFIDTCFPQFFLEIIVRCARKTDTTFWYMLYCSKA